MNRIVVYGSLRRGHGNNSLLEDSDFIDECLTESGYVMRSLGGFPCVSIGGNQSIRGELYSVSDDVLRQLDSLEGHPDWYERQLINVLPFNMMGNWIKAWIYLMPPDEYTDCPVVESGDWGNKTVNTYQGA